MTDPKIPEVGPQDSANPTRCSHGDPLCVQCHADQRRVADNALTAVEVALGGPFDGTEGLDSFTLAWAISQIEAQRSAVKA